MFWKKNNSNKDRKDQKPPPETGPKAADKKTPRDVREEALANMRAARENIGEETVQKIAEAMAKQQKMSPAQAKAEIERADARRVLEALQQMIEDNKRK